MDALALLDSPQAFVNRAREVGTDQLVAEIREATLDLMVLQGPRAGVEVIGRLEDMIAQLQEFYA
jgi:hypothetical protein